MKKCFTLLFLMINSFVFGQSITWNEADDQIQDDDVFLEKMTTFTPYYEKLNELADALYSCAKKKYSNISITIRNIGYGDNLDGRFRVVGDIVSVDKTYNFVHRVDVYLNKAFDKALMNIREGSRFSIDQVTVNGGDIISKINKETMKDNTIDILLDKGYKVVAKEYLERLYQEQQTQQSGIYNENTVVQENNLSAVGYFLNIKITDESLRVQVINVSTGEYEGNATITF